MQDFSTTVSSTDPIARCPSNCNEAMNMAMEEVNQINRIPDAVDRNAAITQAYQNLGSEMEDNWWVRLAGYVSTQGGCAMKNFYPTEKLITGIAAQTIGHAFVNPGDALAALKDANTTIFSSVFPPNKFMSNCGYERLKECNDAGAFQPPLDKDLMDGLEKLNEGDLRGAADLIAQHEQINVVQPVYDRHQGTFDDMVAADKSGWTLGGHGQGGSVNDQTSIPIANECTRDNLVRLGDLQIQSAEDRVQYYGMLMDEMMRIEGLP